MLFVRRECAVLDQIELACADDTFDGAFLNPGVEFELQANDTVYLFVANKDRESIDGPRYQLEVGLGGLPPDIGRLPGFAE